MSGTRLQYILPWDKAREILIKALALSREVKVDQLDCRVSFRRQPTTKTIQEVLDICLDGNKSDTHLHFLCRQGYGEPDYFDVGASTILAEPSYYLWIKLDLKMGEKLISDFQLEPQ